MNTQNIPFDHHEAPRPWSSELPRNPPRTPHDSESTLRLDRHATSASQPHSLSPQATLRPHRHSTPLSQSASTPELYGPHRHRKFTRPFTNLGRHVLKATPPPAVRFDESQLAMFAADNSARMAGIKDEFTIAAGKVTPGVDDTPYIQYALEALTRERASPMPEEQPSPHSAAEYMDNLVRSATLRQAKRELSDVSEPDAAFVTPQAFHTNEQRLAGILSQTRSLPTTMSAPARSRSWDQSFSSSEHWVAITDDMRQTLDPRGRTCPPLRYKPRILRPFSMLILITLCLIMTAALVYSAQASNQHNGLLDFAGTLYSSQYFIFRILPQLLGCVILLYAQSIVNASLRILPFVSLADEDPRARYMALFQPLYPVSLLHPQLVGPWQFKLFDIATWLTLFTVPLLSATYVNVFIDTEWRWMPVQGIVWALVGIYGVLIISTAILMVFWFGKWTGLLWDMRSIADLLPLLNRSNALSSFDQHDLSENKDDFKMQLRDRWFDRLGYWRTGDLINGGTWYTIGAVGARADDHRAGRPRGHGGDERPSFESEDLKAPMPMGGNFGRYLPWCLRNAAIISGAVLSTMLALAILLVAFLPQTRLDDGFLPLLPARPTPVAFSAANFLYSFLPSFVGMILFLLFQSVDMALRRVQPWADLTQLSGAPAGRSLLADYSACHPFQASLRAARNGHWRLAFISLIAQLFVFLPILSGGLLIALTSTDDDKVRMYASMPVFGVLVALLVLYAGCFFLLIPRRTQFELPRPVTTIAAMMSLCSSRELVRDAAFRAIRSREDLKGRLGVGCSDPRQESVWFYGVVPGRDEHRVSVRRMQKYTEKRPVRTVAAMV
ncbi:hypothetical protein VHEMI04110 [[Torrubiella] hemipterigena]|uniref:Phosphoribosylaminoimidazole-succinocarboxamide synthase n=1 Tax=[Torrubiella] hemipterigena TaxID=1531966 RepID=A0A0A1SUI1_9HYPO|nr:hypothetical protein VHEMI04110 [[Torrubiella] hemipterigena]